MLLRAGEEEGFGMIELIAAMVILTIALLALMAGYESAFVSLHAASSKTTAANLANKQLELYSSLPFNGMGLNPTTLQSTKSTDTVYSADENGLNSGLTSTQWTDVTLASCTSTPQCVPVQTPTGSDGRTYRLETFVRDVVSTGTWTERIVTVIVRDPSVSGSPELVRMSAGFDHGPAGT